MSLRDEIAAYFTDEGRPGFFEYGLEVNRLLEERIGLSVFDLPDWHFADDFEDGAEPEETVDAMLEDMGY